MQIGFNAPTSGPLIEPEDPEIVSAIEANLPG